MKEYKYVDYFIDGLARVNYKNKWGVIDSKYNEICECKYYFISKYNGDFANVELNDKYGYINKKGEEIIPCIYNTYVDVLLAFEKYKLNLLRISKLTNII